MIVALCFLCPLLALYGVQKLLFTLLRLNTGELWLLVISVLAFVGFVISLALQPSFRQ